MGERTHRRQDRRPIARRQPHLGNSLGASERHHVQGLLEAQIRGLADEEGTVPSVVHNLRRDDAHGLRSAETPLRLRAVAQVSGGRAALLQ